MVFQVRVLASDGGVPSKSAVESVYINVTCGESVEQDMIRRNLLEIAPVDSYANVTVIAKDGSGNPIPASNVQYRLNHELFYIDSQGIYELAHLSL